MKTSQILCIVLAAALAVVSWQLVKKPSADNAIAQTEETSGHGHGMHGSKLPNPAIQNIMTRTSCRSFSDKLVTEAQIDTLVRAAMAAPTAVNQQPWQIIVITDRDILDSIAANCRNIKMAAEAPMALALCGDMSIAGEKAEDFWVQDLSAATENVLLAANAMGLGAVWCGIYPIPDRTAFIKSLLELPDDIIPLNIIPIGVPKDKLQPKEKYKEERLHYNGY